MKLKDIAQTVTNYAPGLSCKTQPRKHQIVLQYDEEVVYLLSPYYQERVANEKFNEGDMAAILVEVDRIMRYGC